VTAATGLLTLVLNPLANKEFPIPALRGPPHTRGDGAQGACVQHELRRHRRLRRGDQRLAGRARGVVVSDERDPKLTRVITAREGRLLTDETTRRITLRLLNGGVNEGDVEPANPPQGVTTEETTGGAAGPKRYASPGSASTT